MHANLHLNISGGCCQPGPWGGVPPMGGGNQLQQLLQILTALLSAMSGGGACNAFGAQPGYPMPFGNPAFGGFGGGGCGCGMGNPMQGFLGTPQGNFGHYGQPGNYGMPGGNYGAPAMGGFVPPSGSGGAAAVNTARQFLGQRSYDIRGRMPHFQAAGGLTNNCADFVSSALRSGGMLGGHEVNCRRLEQRLLREGWVQIPASQAGPGDVAFNRSRGHVVLCQGNGMMIGSNNVRRGLQYVTEKPLPQSWVVYRKG